MFDLVTSAAEPLVTLAEAKAHLRLADATDDAVLPGLIAAATSIVSSLVGSPLVSEQWRATLPTPFGATGGMTLPPAALGGRSTGPGLVVRIDRPRIRSVDAIRVRSGGAWAAWSSGWSWRVDGGTSIIRPTVGAAWPTMDVDEEAVEVTYTAGFGAAAAVPPPLKIAVLLTLGSLWSHLGSNALVRRETVDGVGTIEWDVSGGLKTSIEASVDRIVFPWRWIGG